MAYRIIQSAMVIAMLPNSIMAQEVSKFPDPQQMPREYLRAFVEDCVSKAKSNGYIKSKGISDTQIGVECGCNSAVALMAALIQLQLPEQKGAAARAAVLSQTACYDDFEAPDSQNLK
jgi:membrane protease subunit (stomatin/prohibitin family)